MSRNTLKIELMNWYLQVLKNYANFSGRARRKEFWFFALFNMLFLFVALIIDNVAGTTIEGVPYGLFYFLYAIAIFIPGLAVTVRRLHDVGKSGWFYFIVLIPIVGAIWFLVIALTDSNTGENEYGPSPKDIQTNNALEDKNTGDTLILFIVIWMLISRLFWTIIPKLIDNYFTTEWFKSVNIIMGLIWAVVPIGLAFAIRNKSKQIALFILGGIYLLYSFYESIMQFIK
jgi:uncharacterized membrane protein YhaH (DUF805 family)